ncbi:hypothetical protein ACRQ1B_22685 [Rhizobium panacihumi]|uniref:hypothetical protein n=1 Tax=Rhizobium panacihumi TaxID=2008450 RepID=UPI003D7A261E
MLGKGLCIAALLGMLLTAPWAFMLIAMGFDAPGATWGWLHTIVAGLPVSLGIISMASLRWATHGDSLPLICGFTLLLADALALALLWILY